MYGLFRRWQRDGTWHRILEQLQARADAKDLITWDISVDSTIARAHQHAAGARKNGRPPGPITGQSHWLYRPLPGRLVKTDTSAIVEVTGKVTCRVTKVDRCAS